MPLTEKTADSSFSDDADADHPEASEALPADEEEPPAAGKDNLVIEDIPDLEDHISNDQLPNVDEYKASIGYAQSSKKKFWMCLAGSVAFVVVLVMVQMLAGGSDKQVEPGSEPTSLRFEAVKKFLHDNKVTNLVRLETSGTTQQKAAAFVADGDGYRMALTEDTMHRFAERYILSLIYYHFEGPKWSHRLNFLNSKDHCTWFHKYTSTTGKLIRQGVKCDEDGRVVELNLSYNNLSANRLPEEIQFMGKLHTLHMYHNPINGYLPEFLKNMPNLKGIGLMDTGISGPIPDWIGKMTQLTTLGLSNNDLKGTIPSSLGKLTNLKLLALDGNKLKGDMEIFSPLTKVEGLFLDHNSFLGEIGGFEKMSNLVSLDVSHNFLYGSIPNGLLNHPNLEVLDVSSNTFSGDLPDDILENDKLEYFSVGSNKLTGKFSARFGFIKSLKHVDISDNNIGGTIPDTLGQLTDLKYLSTSKNKFDQQKVPDLSKLTNLVDLDMKMNNMHGTIPNFAGLSNLILLDLSSNQITGTIPKSIGGLTSLNFLLLNRNKLSGGFPVEMTWLHHVQVLLLDKNDFKADAQDICDTQGGAPSTFITDCYPGSSGEKPEVDCRCCSQCCMDLDYDCNNKEWTAKVDLQYEYGYRRDQYTFSIRDVPVNEAENQDDIPSEPVDPNLGRLLRFV